MSIDKDAYLITYTVDMKGKYKGKDMWIGVQEFGLPVGACPQISSALKSQIDENKAKLDAMAVELEIRRKELEKANPYSKTYPQQVDEYNQLVGRYNALNDATKAMINQYNTQVSRFNNCVVSEWSLPLFPTPMIM